MTTGSSHTMLLYIGDFPDLSLDAISYSSILSGLEASNVTLSWSLSNDDTAPVTYTFELSLTHFSTLVPLHTIITTNTSVTLPLPNDVVYHVSVLATNCLGSSNHTLPIVEIECE